MPTYIPWSDRGPPTYLPPAQLADRLVRSWIAETGRTPSRDLAEFLLAQIILETDWSRAMWRFNWGNISAGSSWPGTAWRPSWYTLVPTSSARDRMLHARMLAGQAPNAFRAYSSHDEGARAYVRFLQSANYAPLLSAANTGDPETFAAAVRSTRYCPDCGEGFGRSVQAVRDQIRAAGWLDSLGSPRAPGGSGLATAALVGALAAAAGYGIYRFRQVPRRGSKPQFYYPEPEV